MTHLRIEQNNGVIEEVSSSVITKLYEIAHAGLDVSSNLQGRLHSAVGIRSQIQWLTSTYPSLYINADDYAIEFEDPNIVTYLNSVGVGSNGIVTEAQAAAATSIYSSIANTTVTKFNEFRYFTNITTSSSGGWGGQGTNYYGFKDWTALEEIDISNLTMVGHGHTYAQVPVFWGCTALKTVTASSSLEKIGTCAFRNCSNLETISGLSGEIALAQRSFENCSKLKSNNFTNVQFLLGTSDNEGNDFSGCTLITSIKVSSNTHKIPLYCFQDCTNLSSITGLSGVTTLSADAFKNCSSLTTLTGLSNVTSVGSECFNGCTSLTAVDIDWSNIVGHTIPNSCFKSCTSLRQLDITGVTQIDKEAFRACSNLTTLTGISGITSIGASAFEGCTNLASTFDFANTTTIQDSAFRNCKNCTFTNLDKVSNFGTTAFGGTNIPTSVQFKDGVSIGMQSFENSNVQSIEFLGGGTIGHKGIQKTKSLQSIVFNADISLGAGCFQECSNLQSVDLSNISEQSLFYNAGYGIGGQFSQCTALSSVTLNPNITKLPSGMFSYCGSSNLELTIPAGVTEIGENFLYGTRGVKLTVLATTPPTLGNQNALGGMTYIKVPAGTLSAYQSAQYWSSKASVMSELPS